MSVKIDWIGCVLLLLALSIIYFIAKYFFAKSFVPSLGFSEVNNMKKSDSLKERLSFLPKSGYCLALFFFIIAFLDPHLLTYKNLKQNSDFFDSRRVIPTEGVAIYLLLDRSGSMAQTVLLTDPKGRKQIPKIDLLKQVTEGFIKKRSEDLIGLIYFARIPHVVAPLTLDHRILLKDLANLQVIEEKQNDGTSLGYAIFKAAHLIVATRYYTEELNAKDQPQYDIKNALIIAVTDGIQDPNYLDKGNRLRTIELEEVAEFAKNQNIKLYIVNIDPVFATEKYAPHRRQMQKITQTTGGEFYLASDGKDLKDIYSKIDDLEASPIPQFLAEDSLVSRRFSFYHYFILAGMACFFLACLLESLYFKSIP